MLNIGSPNLRVFVRDPCWSPRKGGRRPSRSDNERLDRNESGTRSATELRCLLVLIPKFLDSSHSFVEGFKLNWASITVPRVRSSERALEQHSILRCIASVLENGALYFYTGIQTKKSYGRRSSGSQSWVRSNSLEGSRERERVCTLV